MTDDEFVMTNPLTPCLRDSVVHTHVEQMQRLTKPAGNVIFRLFPSGVGE